MTTLDTLKDKWFLVGGEFDEYGLTFRHEGSRVAIATDDNHIEVFYTIQDYYKEWFSLVEEAMSRGESSRIFHAAWGLSNKVRTNPEIHSGERNTRAVDALVNAARSGVGVYALINGGLNLYRAMSSVVVSLQEGGVNALMDRNFPKGGSSHQKFFVSKLSDTEATGLLATGDITGFSNDRGVHELGLKINGPAVLQMEYTFVERAESTYFSEPMEIPGYDGIDHILHPYPGTGSLSIQLLRTYAQKLYAPTHEYSVWASYLNAIQKAQHYIYIEDQYFQTFDYPPCFERLDTPDLDTDLVYQLGQAIKRGVKVVVLTNYFREKTLYDDGIRDSLEFQGDRKVSNYQRRITVEYLMGVAAAAARSDDAEVRKGEFIVGRLSRAGEAAKHYVHTKLMLVDDELSIVGSANFEQRAMTHDNELSLAIVDREQQFTKNLRMGLLDRHLRGRGEKGRFDLADWESAFSQLKGAIAARRGNVMPFELIGEKFHFHGKSLRNIVAPYGGPAQLR